MGEETFESFEETIIEKLEERKASRNLSKKGAPEGDDYDPSDKTGTDKFEEEVSHQGKLILDATVCEQAIRFPTDLGLLWVIQHVYRQQEEMYRTKIKNCNDRIVSISQPHVRPIVRGRANKKVEFGAKLSVSMTGDGIACVDKISWDAYREDN